MATNNFYNHSNGIFILELTEFDQMKEWMETDEAFEHYQEEGFTDEDVIQELNFEHDQTMSEFLEHHLGYLLEEKGYSVQMNGYYKATVCNAKNKVLAELEVTGGYYEGAQLIVETDPYELFHDHYDLFYNDRIDDQQDDFVKSKLYEVYSPHNKTLFKVIESCTTPLKRVAQFSNGEAVYERV